MTKRYIDKQPQRILVDAPSWIGDMVMAQTLFQLLKHKYPNIIIDVIAPTWSADLAMRMPEINRVYATPCKRGKLNLLRRRHFANKVRKNDYQWAILLRNSFKSALIPWFAGIPKRTGWMGEYRYFLVNDIRHLNAKKFPLMTQRFMALGLQENECLPNTVFQPKLQVDTTNQANLVSRLKLTPEQGPILALCPGAEFGPAKRWPAEHFAQTANGLIDKGWQVWIIGSPKEKDLANKINKITENRCVNLASKTTLLDATDLLSMADIALTNDSGLMHISAALDKPLISIFGSSSASFTPPLSDKAHIISSHLNCQPCYKRKCPFNHYQCLKSIEPNRIIETILHIIDMEPSSTSA